MVGLLVALPLFGGMVPGRGAASEVARPVWAGAYEPQGIDERGLWRELDESERILRDLPVVVRDPQLNAFVREVLCDTVGADRCQALRCYIVQDASFNAMMAANGMTLIHTGLLARLHSQAELAGVLGHEFAHFERRHGLAGLRDERARGNWAAVLALLGAGIRAPTGALRRNLALGQIAFTRAQEMEANGLAGQLVAGSRFRLAMAAVWQRQIEEDDALRRERGLRRKDHSVTRLTDDHPADGQRLAWFGGVEARVGPRGEEGREAYRAATARVLSLLFDPLVRGPDFATADYVIRARGEALGWDGELLSLRGDLFRLLAHPRDLPTARDLFRQAIATGRAPPAAWRGLGLVQLRLGALDGADGARGAGDLSGPCPRSG